MQHKTNATQFQKFLVNNKEYLDDKYNEYLQNKSVPIEKIENQTVVKYIYDVFQPDRAESAPQMKNKVEQSLKKSVQDFFKNYSSKTFSSNQAIKLLGFCIENNDLFAVHYDMSETSAIINAKTQKNNNKNHIKGQLKNIVSPHQKSNHFQGQQDNLNGAQNQFSERFNIQNVQNVRDQNKSNHLTQVQSSQIVIDSNNHMKNSFLPSDNHLDRTQNQFDRVESENPIPKYDQKIIKKNIKLAFEFYCKQQMAIGVNNTFDYLDHQKSTMNIGGFLIFAQYCGILGRQLSKRFLMSKFRKVSQGKSQIDFDTFYLLMVQLQVVDSTLYARSKLDSLDFNKELKAARLAFNTKDQNPRQLVGFRKFTNKLTGHSGKFQQQLQQDYIRHSSNMSKIKKQTSESLYPLSARNRYESQIIKTKDLQKLLFEKKKQAQFLGKIISPQDNDNRWLHQYKIDFPHQKKMIERKDSQSRQSKIIGSMKQRISELQHRQKLYSRKRNSKIQKPAVFAAKK